MSQRIAVLGAGAIGSCLGASFTDAGHDVTIVDQWPEHVEAMKRSGLKIHAPDRDLQVGVRALHLCELAAARPGFDVVFLASKAYDARWMSTLIAPYLAADGVVVVTQNGMTDDIVADVTGRERTIGAVVELSAEIFTPGIVQRDTTKDGTWFALGELDGSITPRLEAVRSILSAATRVDLTDDIGGAKWTKLIANSMTMGPFGLFGLRNWEAVKLPGMFEISVQLGRESMAVGAALGYTLQPIFGLTAEEFAGSSDEVLITAMETLMQHVGKASSTAPVHDHKKGRLSELEYINGEVVRRGSEAGVPTPCNEIVLRLDRRICAAELTLDPSNLDLLKAEVAGLSGAR